jgi:uncharacterized protein (TIGR04255 family)
MKIPRKITPDNLKDTIIEIRYNLNVAPEFVLGILYQALCNKYQYIQPNIPIQNIPVEINPANNVFLGLKPIGFFSDGSIKIQIQENSIIFNSLENYLGWEKYFASIQVVLDKIKGTNVIHSFNRVGVRYISQYDNLSIFSKINGKIILFNENFQVDNATLRTEFVEADKRIILNLSNNIKPQEKQAQISFYSLIDIDIISGIANSDNMDSLFKIIDETHYKQKEVFFRLLDENYVKSLNPEF